MRPGCWSSPGSSTLTPTPASLRTRSRTGSSRIRSRPRSVARRRSCRSTTPGRVVTRGRAIAADRTGGVARRDRGRQLGGRLRSLARRLGSCRRPPRRAARHDRSRRGDVQGVHGVRLPAADQALFDAMRLMGERGGMLQVHCEDPVLLDAGVAAALQRGDVAPRYHATTRPPYVEAVATARAMAFARATDSPVHVVHSRRQRPSTRCAAARQPGSGSRPRRARTTSC